MSFTISDYNKTQHEEQVVSLLLDLQDKDDNYPPRTSPHLTEVETRDWFNDGSRLQRRVALTLEGLPSANAEQVEGHVAIGPPHDYILKFLQSIGSPLGGDQLGEVGKFFVRRNKQGTGVGQLLFADALTLLRSQNLTPVLAVIEASTKAVIFYERQGLTCLGSFNGIHGINRVFVGDSLGENTEMGGVLKKPAE